MRTGKVKAGRASKTMEDKKKSIPDKNKKKYLGQLTANEFFEQNFSGSSDDSNDDDGNDQEIENIDVEENENNEPENSDSCKDDSGESDLDPEEHKKSLMKLKDTDPEFYKYLKENDKQLLDFNMSDDEESTSGKPTSNESRTKIERDNDDVFDADSVASDENDYKPEKETEGGSKKKITLQLLATWKQEIQTDNSITTIKRAIEAFHAALNSVAVSPDDTVSYKVEGSAVFNSVMELCILYLPDALERFLKLDSVSREVHKSKRFVKVRTVLKLYLSDLIKLLQSVSSTKILTVLLKHLRQMLFYVNSFSSLIKPLLKILLTLWATKEETVRIVSFLNIIRIATSHKEFVMEKLLKTMYMKYVQNAKFMSPGTLKGIEFMKRSLIEIYLLDENLSYSHAFLYIRQLAIHLRNAMTLKKKENFQAVYNWQYINSLRFWTDLISKTKHNSSLRSLLYPLVQIIVGTIKVIPTPQYYPLRFHCIQMLVTASNETNTYIHVLSFLLEILETFDFNKKFKTANLKPTPFTCILRLSKCQLDERNSRDSIMDTIYQLILEYSANESNKMYFPELYIPCIIRLKAFLKNCHVPNYYRKMKQLLTLIENNRTFILDTRSTLNIDLHDLSSVTELENKIKLEGTEVAKFYAVWLKVQAEAEKYKHVDENAEKTARKSDRMKWNKRKRRNENSKDNEDGEEEEEEEDDDAERPLAKKAKYAKKRTNESSSDSKTKSKKTKQTKKNKNNEQLQEDYPDIVQDIDDWD